MATDYWESSIKGLKETNDVFRKLPAALQQNVLRTSTRAGARLILKAAQAKAPRSGVDRSAKFKNKPSYYKKHLADQIKISTVEKGKTYIDLSVHIGSAFWGKFKEFGTSKMSAEPWMRPAFDASSQQAFSKMISAFGSGLVREVNKLNGPLKKSGLLK